MRVLFKDANGSVGTAIGSEAEGKINVVWSYGRDVDGCQLIASETHKDFKQLIEIPEELFQEYTACKAWSDEQKPLRLKLHMFLPENMRPNRECSRCEHWGADLDSDYCAHPEAIKKESLGISINVARNNEGFCGPEGKLWEPRTRTAPSPKRT